MKDERLVENLNKFNNWSEDQKQYIINHCYFDKIKDYFFKEYSGMMNSEPIVFEEYDLGILDVEEYKSTLSFTIHYKKERFPGDDCISFRVDYQFNVSKDGTVWETFDAYRKSDNVYLQGGLKDKKYPIVYRDEYTRSWQEGGFRYIYTRPKEER